MTSGRDDQDTPADPGTEELLAALPALDDHAARALQTAGQWVGGEIQGVGIGQTVDGADCVVVMATDLTTERVRSLPTECEGLPVRVQHTDELRAE